MVALIFGLATALVAALAVLFVAALVAAPRDMPRSGLLRVYPDVVRLLVGLARDKRVARPVRWRLLVALAYNAQPINLIPDFIPVIGLADNVVVSAWAVRSAIRKSGAEVVLDHWPGSSEGFILVCRLCRVIVLPGQSRDGEAPARAADSPAREHGSAVHDPANSSLAKAESGPQAWSVG